MDVKSGISGDARREVEDSLLLLTAPVDSAMDELAIMLSEWTTVGRSSPSIESSRPRFLFSEVSIVSPPSSLSLVSPRGGGGLVAMGMSRAEDMEALTTDDVLLKNAGIVDWEDDEEGSVGLGGISQK